MRQIELSARAPGQRPYELIRPVVLFGQSAAERAAETGAAERTRSRQVARFDQLGMASLAPPPKVEKHRLLPAQVRQAILDAKREHPPRNGHELTTSCWARCGHRPSTHTVKRILAESPPHFAHQERPEDRRSPAAVLHRVCGKLVAPAKLHHIFSSTRFGRVVDRAGYARFRRWRVSAERGLGGEPVAVWLYAEHLTLVYQDEPLAQYRVAYQPDQRRLQMVTPEQLFETPHRSPQPPLWAWGEGEWLEVSA